MKLSEVKEALLANKYNLERTAIALDIDVEDLKEIVKENNLLPEKKKSFKAEVIDNMENFINDKYSLAMIIKGELIRDVSAKKLSVTDPQFMSGMKYVDDILRECFQLSKQVEDKGKNKRTVN
jgi:hypothetical protein